MATASSPPHVRYLQILNMALAALGITLAVVLAVESFIYAWYLGADPLVRRQLPLLLELTAVFAVFTAAALLAFFAQRRQYAWRWPAQLLPFFALAAVAATLAQLRK